MMGPLPGQRRGRGSKEDVPDCGCLPPEGARAHLLVKTSAEYSSPNQFRACRFHRGVQWTEKHTRGLRFPSWPNRLLLPAVAKSTGSYSLACHLQPTVVLRKFLRLYMGIRC